MNKIDFGNHNASVHEEKKQHNCSRCSASFKTLVDFEYHIESVHEGMKQHNCNKCSFTLENNIDLFY